MNPQVMYPPPPPRGWKIKGGKVLETASKEAYPGGRNGEGKEKSRIKEGKRKETIKGRRKKSKD